VELSGKKICLKRPRERKTLSVPDVFGVTRWSEFDFLFDSTRQNALQQERGFFTGIDSLVVTLKILETLGSIRARTAAHYVRSADFVMPCLEIAIEQDPNESKAEWKK
jgi:hypothetical protein